MSLLPQHVQHERMNHDARASVRASMRRVLCPRTKGRITERGCQECRSAARLVPVLFAACSACSRFDPSG